MLLSLEKDNEVVGHTQNDAEAPEPVAQHRPDRAYLSRINRPGTADKMAEPIIVHTRGKLSLPMVMVRKTGRPTSRASQVQIKAPTNPTSVDIAHPPRE